MGSVGRTHGGDLMEGLMAENWADDVKKYVKDADDDLIAAIVRYCGIALRNRDSSLVSFSDKAEVARVRENFLRKKLGLTDSDETLNAAIDAVGQQMKGDRTRNRVTVYYLLLKQLGAEGKLAKAKPKTAKAGAPSKATAAKDTGAANPAKPTEAKPSKPAKAAETKPSAAKAKPAKAAKAPVAKAAPVKAAKLSTAKTAPAKAAVAIDAAAGSSPLGLGDAAMADTAAPAPAPSATTSETSTTVVAAAPTAPAVAAPVSEESSDLGWVWWLLLTVLAAFLIWWLFLRG